MGVSAKIMMWGLNDFLVLRLNLSQVSSQVSEVRLKKSQSSLKAAKLVAIRFGFGKCKFKCE